MEFWLSVNRHRADLQDVLLNEPWFFIEGCLWGLFALTALAPSVRRRWLHSAAVACAGASIVGVLAASAGFPRFASGSPHAEVVSVEFWRSPQTSRTSTSPGHCPRCRRKSGSFTGDIGPARFG